MNARKTGLAGRVLLASLVAACIIGGHTRAQAAARPLNILFVILDDVGEDILASFNPAAANASLTPTLNAIIAAGVKFTNFYTMPECSPSRVAFFTGRYPLRTGVTDAILDTNLPAAQISPFEVTVPRVLATAGYTSGLIGKYHLGGPENNPDGIRAPVALGWNYFNGNPYAYPPPPDPTLGRQYTKDTTKYSCGFPTGPKRGAAWFQTSPQDIRCDDNQRAGFTGQEAVARGGIPALDPTGELALTCREATGAKPDFSTLNGYYVWPQTVDDSRVVVEPTARQYMTTAQTDAAIAWIRNQPREPERRPWMATVSYNAIHTSYQQPPPDLYPPGFVWPANVPEDCTNVAAQRVISQLMLAAMDRELGRLFVGIGLAQRADNGQLIYRPELTDTMVVIAGDNGTYLPVVLPPYEPTRAKGTPYETGVKTPLIVAGPLVVGANRSVAHLVNSVDLFQLFGEIAGVDVRAVVPRSHVLDAEPMLAYVTNPSQPAGRRYNFSQLASGLKPTSVKLWPCVLKYGPINLAIDTIFTAQSQCEGNGGDWYGPTLERPTPLYPTSCAVKAANLYSVLGVAANRVWAMRNRDYKLVKVERPSCEADLGEFEFYDVSVSAANPIGLDHSNANLLIRGQPVGLTSTQSANFLELQGALQALLNSEPACPGDGNLDKTVNTDDLSGILHYFGKPSVFDFNHDGVTDTLDYPDVLNNFGKTCR